MASNLEQIMAGCDVLQAGCSFFHARSLHSLFGLTTCARTMQLATLYLAWSSPVPMDALMFTEGLREWDAVPHI